MVEQTCKVFNGHYTIKSGQTGDHRTFRIRTQPEDADFAPGKRIVGLLTGPDNEVSYTGFAFIDDDGIFVWSKKRGEGLWATYAEMLWSLALDGEKSPWTKKGYSLMVEGRCIKCNRLLTEPSSLETGVGPVCAGRS